MLLQCCIVIVMLIKLTVVVVFVVVAEGSSCRHVTEQSHRIQHFVVRVCFLLLCSRNLSVEQIIAFDAFARVSCKREVSGISSEFAPSLGQTNCHNY